MAKTPQLTYAKAYDIILHNQHLTTAERIILILVCRYFPRPCSMSNETLAHHSGLSIRQVQYCLKALSTGPTKRTAKGASKRRAYIVREYAHITHEGKTYTARLIYPVFLPGPRTHRSQTKRGRTK